MRLACCVEGSVLEEREAEAREEAVAETWGRRMWGGGDTGKTPALEVRAEGSQPDSPGVWAGRHPQEQPCWGGTRGGNRGGRMRNGFQVDGPERIKALGEPGLSKEQRGERQVTLPQAL